MNRPNLRRGCALGVVAIAFVVVTHVRADQPQPLPWVEGSTTLAVLPDTEVYTRKYPHYFEAQTKWIAENCQERNIAYTIHLGDITQRNLEPEWELARRCFGMLDGKVPYALAPGNHDYDGGQGRPGTKINEYFPFDDLKTWRTYGGAFQPGRIENTYHLLSIGDQDWIILALEIGPRDEVVAWANKVLEQHADRLAIVVTHAYLFRDNKRYDHLAGVSQRASPHGWGNDGEQLWQKLVRRHRNVMIVLSAHVSTGGLGYLASEGDYGNTVHQMMCDYEKMSGGGQAFMRLLEFLPDGKTVQVRTYSPALQSTRQSDLEEFRFELKLADRDTPKPREDTDDPPLKMPIHRYSFDGTGGADAQLVDSIGDAHGVLRSETGQSKLDKQGRLVLAGNDGPAGYVDLPPRMLDQLTDVTIEVWFTPSAEHYNWNCVWRFGDGGGDFFWYNFRTLNCHRADISVAGDNEDIQRKDVPAAPGKRAHYVVTYDADRAEGRPMLRYYRDGQLAGWLVVNKRLGDVDDTQNRLGPIAGAYDELRIYDYPLGPTAVRRSFQAGPDKLDVAESKGD